MIRYVLKNEIGRLINNTSYFEITDFEITDINKGDVDSLEIQHRFEPRYKFVASIPHKKEKEKDNPFSEDYRISVRVSPGEITFEEFLRFNGKAELFSGIATWIERVKEDICAKPVYQEMAKLREEVLAFLKEFEDVKDESFSREEIDELKGKLDELEKKLQENIRKTVKEQNQQNAKIKLLEKDIGILKEKLETSSKKGWFVSMKVRFSELFKDPINRQILQSGVQMAEELAKSHLKLPPGQ